MKNSPTSSTYFRVAYEKFYSDMRQYLWDLTTLEILADIEVLTYESFIDIEKLRNKMKMLYQCIHDIMKDDEYLEESYNNFNELIEDSKDSDMYFKLYQVEEV